ncbi:MAG: T9SS type A sorting domain-containing protein [Bacteroidota bacterium]
MKTLIPIACLLLSMTSYVEAQNTAPVAVNDTITIYHKGETHAVNVITNDVDAEGDSIYISWAPLAQFSSTSLFVTPLNGYETKIKKILYRIKDESGNQSNVATLVVKLISTLPDSLTISNINARINPNNNNFWDMQGDAKFEAPKGSGKGTMFNSALWISGLENGFIHLAADSYHSNGVDFYQGPLKTNGTGTDSATMVLYNRSWKVRSSEIDALRAYQANPSAFPNYVIPEAILNWPAHGGAGYANYIAPFEDVDQDGIYEPQNLDFPKIKGDEAIFYVVNDKGGLHTESGGTALGVEIQVMAYAFDCSVDSALFNSIFIDYTIINRSVKTYNNTFFGSLNDVDLGSALDDFIGSDVMRNTVYCYNGKSIDDIYGSNPPIQSITILRGPYRDANNEDDLINDPSIASNGNGYSDGITDNEQHGMDGFMCYNNMTNGTVEPMTDPDSVNQYYYLLQSKWKDNTSLMYGENGHITSGASEPCKYMYPGLSDTYNWGTGGVAPTADKNWTEITAANVPNDRRGLLTSGGFTFMPGATQHFELAYTFNRNYTDTSRLAALPIMQARVDSLRSYFKAERTPCGSIFASIEKKNDIENSLKVYPNPAKDFCKIEYICEKSEAIIISVYDINGRVVIAKKANTIIGKNSISLNTNELNSGVYIVKVESNSENKVVRLVVN